jgi:hypothetical protein
MTQFKGGAMETVLFNIVTDTEQRDTDTVAEQLEALFSVGAFWFD